MTPSQSKILNFISEYVDNNDYSPTYQEIADGVGLASKSGINAHINSLVRQGHLTKLDRARRTVWPTKREKL